MLTPVSVQRKARAQLEAAAVRGARRHVTAVDLQPLAHSDQAVPLAVAGDARAAVVADGDLQRVRAVLMTTSAWLACACLRVLGRPSWMIRYADRSSAAGSAAGVPSTRTSTILRYDPASPRAASIGW